MGHALGQPVELVGVYSGAAIVLLPGVAGCGLDRFTACVPGLWLGLGLGLGLGMGLGLGLTLTLTPTRTCAARPLVRLSAILNQLV